MPTSICDVAQANVCAAVFLNQHIAKSDGVFTSLLVFRLTLWEVLSVRPKVPITLLRLSVLATSAVLTLRAAIFRGLARSASTAVTVVLHPLNVWYRGQSGQNVPLNQALTPA